MNSDKLKQCHEDDKKIFRALNMVAQSKDNLEQACDTLIDLKCGLVEQIDALEHAKGEIENQMVVLQKNVRETESRLQSELTEKVHQINKLEEEKNELEGWRNKAETIERAMYSRIPQQLESEPNTKIILDAAKNAIAGESILDVVQPAQQLVHIISLLGECGPDAREDGLKLLGHYLNVFTRKCGWPEDDICNGMRAFAAVYNEKLLAGKFKLEVPSLQCPLDDKIAKSRSNATNVAAVYNWAIKDGNGKVLVRAEVG